MCPHTAASGMAAEMEDMVEQLLHSMHSSSAELVQMDSSSTPLDPKKFPPITAEIARHIDTSITWMEAISITFLFIDKPNLAHMLAR